MAVPQNWWFGNQFMMPPVAMPPRRQFPQIVPPVPQGPSLPSPNNGNGAGGNPGGSPQGGGEGSGGGQGGISSGTSTGVGLSAAPFSSMQAPSGALTGGLLGTATSLAAGVPGFGLLGGLVGSGFDTSRSNDQLEAVGMPRGVDFGPAALSAATLGLLGTTAADQARNLSGFSPQGLTDLAGTGFNAQNASSNDPLDSMSPQDRDAAAISGLVSMGDPSFFGGEMGAPSLDYSGPETGIPSESRGGFGAGTGAAGMGGVGGGASGEAGGNYGAVGGENSYGFSDQNSGGSDAGSSGSVICTELVRQGLMTRERRAESRRHAMTRLSPEIIRGYQWWAVTAVKIMRKSPRISRVVAVMTEWRGIEIAYRLGVREKGDWRGWLVQEIGAGISLAIGRCVKQRNYHALYEKA